MPVFFMTNGSLKVSISDVPDYPLLFHVRFLSYQILRPAFFAGSFSYFPMFQKTVIAFMIENYVIKKFDSQGFTGGF